MTRSPFVLAKISALLAAVIGISSLNATAQETYWVANRASGDLMELTTWGTVITRVDLGASLRSAHKAPDGKVWVVHHFASGFEIYDLATATTTSVPHSLGSPVFDIAFDAQGTAWVSGGTGVENYDSNGASILAYPLPAAAPRGITIDSAGNKWIAHRNTAGSVSRIDANGAVTNFSVSASQPVRPMADYRGANPSHIWVGCDGNGSLLELDSNGTELGNHTMPSTLIGGVGPVFDLNGDIWVGSFGSGQLFQVDGATGAPLNTYLVPPSVIALAVDSLGRLLLVARVTYSGVGPPCEVTRVDPATGVIEMNTELEFGGNNAIGSNSAPSTPFQYCLVVDPLGDLDGDGDTNSAEIIAGTFPTDPWSNATGSISARGVSNGTTGGLTPIDVIVPAGTAWGLTWSFGITTGGGFTLPGVGGSLLLDLTLLLPVSFSGTGTVSLPFLIPADPGYIGLQVGFQALFLGTLPRFSNLTGFKIF